MQHTNTQGIKFQVEEEAIKLLFTLLLPQRCKELHSHQTLQEKMQQTSPEKKNDFSTGFSNRGMLWIPLTGWNWKTGFVAEHTLKDFRLQNFTDDKYFMIFIWLMNDVLYYIWFCIKTRPGLLSSVHRYLGLSYRTHFQLKLNEVQFVFVLFAILFVLFAILHIFSWLPALPALISQIKLGQLLFQDSKKFSAVCSVHGLHTRDSIWSI